jgi:SAM-dependent methyltransferase
MLKDWNDVYKKEFRATWCPNDGIVRLVARYLKRRKGVDLYDVKKDTKRVLDVGCGNGNHTIFLAELGYDVYGIDISSEAIDIAKAWFNKKGLEADLRAGDVERLPYEDDFFDLIISDAVLDHMLFSKAKKVMSEIKRTCVKGGYVFITLRSTEDSEFGRGKKEGPNTFELAGGYEKGLIQHYFDLEEIKELLEGFKVFDIDLCEERFPDTFTIDKSFLQSSKGLKKYIDLSRNLDMGLKNSRWYIAAEKI